MKDNVKGGQKSGISWVLSGCFLSITEKELCEQVLAQGLAGSTWTKEAGVVLVLRDLLPLFLCSINIAEDPGCSFQGLLSLVIQ